MPQTHYNKVQLTNSLQNSPVFLTLYLNLYALLKPYDNKEGEDEEESWHIIQDYHFVY